MFRPFSSCVSIDISNFDSEVNVLKSISDILFAIRVMIKDHRMISTGFFSFYRYFVSAGRTINSTSDISILYSIRTYCNDKDNTCSYRLLFQSSNRHQRTKCSNTIWLSICFAVGKQIFVGVVLISRNFVSSHWCDSF